MDSFLAIAGSLLFILTAGIHTGTPLVLAALGGAFSAQVNVFNIALEGQMLAGAFFGFMVSHLTGSVWLGLGAGMLSGIIMGLIFAVACITFHSDEIIVGFAINLVALSLTAVLLKAAFGSQGSYLSSKAGLVVPFFSTFDIVVLIAVACIAASHWLVYRTKTGLRFRAIGSFPEAVSAAGINVGTYRYAALIIGGGLCGLAGAYLPLSGLSLFSVGMTAGAGFIAVAAVIFGDGKPLVVAGAAFLFGIMAAVGIELQRFGWPNEIVLMVPYVATVVVLTLKVARSHAGKAGKRNRAEEKAASAVSV